MKRKSALMLAMKFIFIRLTYYDVIWIIEDRACEYYLRFTNYCEWMFSSMLNYLNPFYGGNVKWRMALFYQTVLWFFLAFEGL